MQITYVTAEQYDLLIKFMDEPSEPSPALLAAAERYADAVASGEWVVKAEFLPPEK
jgi:uncharacterized protein (DUF1778 family)